MAGENNNSMIHIYVALGLLAVAVGVAFLGRRQSTKTDAYGLYVEASKTSELAPGVPGFYGGVVTAVPERQPLTAPYSKQPCVWYEFTLEQEVRQRGANGVETVDWQVISNPQPQGVSFALQAAGGVVWVNPMNAQVDHPQQYESFVEPQAAQGGGLLGAAASAINFLSNNRVRVRERYIPLGQTLYAGGVTQDQAGQKVFVNDQAYPLVLTPQSKADLVKSGKRTSLLEYSVGLVLFAAAVVTLLVVKK
jgi:hypothetical protein